ncbi:hypothetical protein ACQ4PT_050802 [Festuca glaucescens]
MVFVTSPTYAEVVERIRFDLKWMEASDACELIARYNAGFGHHNRLKIMPVDSELNWSAYKEIVAGSQDKSLELFATRKFVARLNIDLNQHASPCARDEPPHYHSADVYDTSMSQPPLSQPVMSPVHNDQYEEEEMKGDDYEGDEAEHGYISCGVDGGGQGGDGGSGTGHGGDGGGQGGDGGGHGGDGGGQRGNRRDGSGGGHGGDGGGQGGDGGGHGGDGGGQRGGRRRGSGGTGRGMVSGGWRNYGKKVPQVVEEKVKNKWEVPEIPLWEQLQYRKRYAEATRKMDEKKAEEARERFERSWEDASRVMKKLVDEYDLKRKKMIEDDKKAKEWELEREKARLARAKAAEEDARKQKVQYGRCTQ